MNRCIFLTAFSLLLNSAVLAQKPEQFTKDYGKTGLGQFHRIHPPAGNDTIKLNTLLNTCQHWLELKDYHKLQTIAREVVKFAENKQVIDKLPKACYYAAMAHFLLANYDSCLNYCSTGLSCKNITNDSWSFIKLNAIACKALSSQEQYPQAAVYAYNSLKKAEEIKDSHNMAKSYQLISGCFFYQDNFKAALSYDFKALEYYRRQHLFINIAQTCNSIGEALTNLDKPDDAIQYHLEAEQAFSKAGNDAPLYFQANLFNYLGTAYEKKADHSSTQNNLQTINYNKALHYYLSALREWQKFKEMELFAVAPVVVGEISITVGKLLYKLGKFEKCRKFINTGIFACRENGALKKLSDGYLVQAGLDSINGKFESSFEHYKLYVKFRDSILNYENKRRTEWYKEQNEFEKKEKELLLRISDEKLTSALAQKRKQQLIFSWIMASLLLASAIIIFYRYRHAQKIKAEKELLKERLSISQDLHDHIGSTLSSISVYSKVAQIQGGKGQKEELDNLLGRIRNASGNMITEMNDIVWAINPLNDSVEKIVERMENYGGPLLLAANMAFDFSYPGSVKNINLDMTKRRNFFLVFKEAINNIIKYSAATKVEAAIDVIGEELRLNICDNGVGFNMEAADQKANMGGNGLHNMQLRAQAVNGKLFIESSPGKGCRLVLSVPI